MMQTFLLPAGKSWRAVLISMQIMAVVGLKNQNKKRNNPMHDIVFINPPNHCKEDYISLGLQNLYSIIKNAGYRTDFIDLQKRFISGELTYHEDALGKIDGIIKPAEAKIYAFTVWNTSFPWVTHICRFIKKINSRAITLIGGPLSTLCSTQILKDYDCIDIACRFEGELIIEPLVATLLSSGVTCLESIKNLDYRTTEGAILSTGDAPLMENLDALPWVEMTPAEFKSPVINIEAGRGCSFHCYYCSSCFIWKFKPRYKSGTRLFSEIACLCSQYQNAGMKPPVFHLEHDNFLMRNAVLLELDEQVQKAGLSFKYGFAGRADLITDKTLELLKRTGCVYVYLGIETGSVHLQKITKKNLSFSTVFSAIRDIQNHGISVHANIMFGFPEETPDDLHETLELLNTLRFLGVTVYVSLLSPELKTPVGEGALLTDYLFNESSPYVMELIQCGINPGAYREIYLNHLYTLKNSHYDILRYNGFVQFWHSLAANYPMTVHLLSQNNGSDKTYNWRHRFSVWDHQINPRHLSEFPASSIPDLFRLFDSRIYKNEDEREITHIETHLALRSGKDPLSADLSAERLRAYYKVYDRVRKKTLAKINNPWNNID
jgi:radical SAM superfamily enzyme YgiQ (UPF0313 family)